MKIYYFIALLSFFNIAYTQDLGLIADTYNHYLRHRSEKNTYSSRRQIYTNPPSHIPTPSPVFSESETYYYYNNFNLTDDYNTTDYSYNDYYEDNNYYYDTTTNDETTKTSNPVLITNYIGKWYTLYAEDNVFLFTGYGSAIHNEDVTKSSKKLERITAYAHKLSNSEKHKLGTDYDYYAYFDVLPYDGTQWTMFLNNLNVETAYYKYTVIQDHDGTISVWGKPTTDTVHNPPLDDSCRNSI